MKDNQLLHHITQKYQLIHVPGIGDSGPTHWHTHWEKANANIVRVQQQDWDAPDCQTWVNELNKTILKHQSKPIILVAHSLGGGAIIHAANQGQLKPVAGIFMVALPDIERADFPETCTGFIPMPRNSLPIPTMMVASENDEWCDFSIAEKWADILGAQFVNIGKKDHVCGAPEFVEWTEGQALLLGFTEQLEGIISQ